MVKIVIFVTILALACVDAQFDLFNPGAMMDSIWKHPMFENMNNRVPNPKDFMSKMKPVPGQEYHSSMISSTMVDGKAVTSMKSNDNGKTKEVIVTN